jgi:hypothetical protein
MVDVDCAVGDRPCLTAADDSGYEIDEAEVIYWGRCPDCVTAPPRRPARDTGPWSPNEQRKTPPAGRNGEQNETVSE